ncbi:hypothetical protein TB1_000839 [Malus domestica]
MFKDSYLDVQSLMPRVALVKRPKVKEKNGRSIDEISVSHGCIVYDVTPELPFTQLSSCLSQLEILELDTNGVDDYIQTHAAFPIITNLKHLKLLVNVQHVNYIVVFY